MSSAVEHTSNTIRPVRPWTIGWMIEWALVLLITLVVGLLLSIIIEWLGMTLDWWDKPGALHARALLEQEFAFLESTFESTVLTSHPLLRAERGAHWFYEISGMATLLQWLSTSPDFTIPLMVRLHTFCLQFGHYFLAAGYIIQLYGARLVVVLMSLSVFALFGIIGLVDGLVQRDLRRFSGGHESSFIYHHLKPLLKPMIWLPILVYLTVPFSLHPNLVFVIPAVFFGYTLAKLIARFKKYL